MPEQARITARQLMFIIFVSRLAIVLTFLPSLSEPPGNHDTWISGLVAILIIILCTLPVYILWRKFPRLSIIQYSELLAGKAGKLIGLLYVWAFSHFMILNLCQLSFFLETAIMPETPIIFFKITMLLVCAYAVIQGIEVIGRLTEIFAPLLILTVITIYLLLLKNMDYRALLPVMEKPIYDIFQGAMIGALRTTEIFVLGMLLPFLDRPEEAKTSIFKSYILIMTMYLLIIISVITSYGHEIGRNLSFPFYSVARLIRFGFLERIEAIHGILFLSGVFIKLALYYYLAVLGLAQACGLRDYKPLVLPAATVLLPLSLIMAPRIIDLQQFNTYNVNIWYTSFFTVIIPCLLLIISFFKKKGSS